MSLLTTRALKTAPSAAAGTVVPTAAATWTFGAWVQVLASAAADLTVAGIVYAGGVGVANTHLEIEIGIGIAGGEVGVGVLRLLIVSPTGGSPGVVMLPVPVSGITAGSRVALRARSQSGSAVSPALVLLYYQSFDSDAVLATPACLPSGGVAVVTPSAVAWANSAYVQLTTGLASEASLYGLTVTVPFNNLDAEFDLATGAAGAETVITTLRCSALTNTTGLLSYLPLSAVHPVPASTPIAIRVRKAGTATTAYAVALLYYAGTTFLPSVGAGALAQPYVWGPL